MLHIDAVVAAARKGPATPARPPVPPVPTIR